MAIKAELNERQAEIKYRIMLSRIIRIKLRHKNLEIGIYVHGESWDSQLDIIESFGVKKVAELSVGLLISCDGLFEDSWRILILRRLDLITCWLPMAHSMYPEETAKLTVVTCDAYQQHARVLNLTAEILCASEYSTHIIENRREFGSSLNFEKFWCKLAYELTLDNSHARVIMLNVLDESFRHNGMTVSSKDNLSTGGLWRRIHSTSFNKSAFLDVTKECAMTHGTSLTAADVEVK